MEENIQDNSEELQEIQEEKKRELIEYQNIETRLKEIEEKITSDDMDMDESLNLYEEAVNLGMKASQTIENNVLVNDYDENNQEEQENSD